MNPLKHKLDVTPTVPHTVRSIGSQKNMTPQIEKGDSLRVTVKQPIRSTKHIASGRPLVEINGLQPVGRSVVLTPIQPLLPMPSVSIVPEADKRKRDDALEPNSNTSSPKKPSKKRMYPPGVKGPRNAFTIFQKELYSSVRKEHPNLNTNEVSQRVAEMWKEADENTKKEYSEKAAIDKERFERDMEAATLFPKKPSPVGRPKYAASSNVSTPYSRPPPQILPTSSTLIAPSQTALPTYSPNTNMILPTVNELPNAEYFMNAYGQKLGSTVIIGSPKKQEYVA